MSISTGDSLQRFSFDDTTVRGEIAQLTDSYQEILQRHSYPQPVAVLLGELLAATALLSASLKFPGRLTLQIRMDGNITLLQAETDEKQQLRGIARYDDTLPDDQLVAVDGHLVLTLEPLKGQRYQGISTFEQGSISDALERYFDQSEQLPSRFWLASDGQTAAGFMLQKVPQSGSATHSDSDAWNRLGHLASTLKDDELLTLDRETLLHRLYHEESIRVYPADNLTFFCTCSKDRMSRALVQLGYQELNDMLVEMGMIDINCEFCQQHYGFDRQDIEQLFPERHPH